MKKIICLILSLILMVSVLSGCFNNKENSTESPNENSNENSNENIIPELSVWDGSVATAFAGGDGSAENPYKIASAEQLAFLAKQVNEGNQYGGKHISLLCDIDLNNLDWTPIGNGTNSFMGIFDGNGHVIKKLRISQTIRYHYEYPTGIKFSYCDLGLFATVQDASIQNMTIDGATIEIADNPGGVAHQVGVLCGTVRTYESSSVISNISIKNATIAAQFPGQGRPESLCIGGAIGYLYAYNNTTTTISRIEANSMLSFEQSYGLNNYMGTILGCSNILDSTFTLENCVAYQAISVTPEQYYYTITNDFCGMIANAQASAKPFTVKNVFSKTTVSKPEFENTLNAPVALVSNAIIGTAYYYALKDDPGAVGYKFENVFGCIEHVDAKTGQKDILTDLYALPQGTTFSQINCYGCEVLPENHGFDTTVWDLSDMSKPKLK